MKRTILATLCGLAVACGTDGTGPKSEVTGFAALERQVLVPSCATSGCHTGSNPAGSLDLGGGHAYANLVGVTPANVYAARDGLKRVMPGKPDSSLLYHKLDVTAGHHSADYGAPMPAGGLPALSAGQLEFVRQWIAAGAPRDGAFASTDLLADKTPQASTAFTPLVAPPAGQGIQLRIDPFQVQPSFERELFVYRPFRNASSLFVTRIETRMRPGSHHLLLYTMASNTPALGMPQPDAVRDIRNPDGTMNFIAMIPMAYHVFFGGSMTPASDYAFPAGVALRLPPNSGIDLNAHYVNRTASPITGEAYANLWTTDSAKVQSVARTLNCGNQNISLPAKTRTTLEHQCTFNQRTTVFLLTSHMHALGERFQIRIVGGARNGELLYDNTDWEHPLILQLRDPVVLEAGQGLRATITWNNTTDKVVTFGLTSTDEMGIIFGYAY